MHYIYGLLLQKYCIFKEITIYIIRFSVSILGIKPIFWFQL
jgi:hypothetical protein